MCLVPLYEYKCRECEHSLTKLQGINDEPLTLCEKCGNASLIKRFPRPSFKINGGGSAEGDSGKSRR